MSKPTSPFSASAVPGPAERVWQMVHMDRLPIGAVAKRLGIGRPQAFALLAAHVPIERAREAERMKMAGEGPRPAVEDADDHARYLYEGERRTVSAIADLAHVSYSTLYHKLKDGYSIAGVIRDAREDEAALDVQAYLATVRPGVAAARARRAKADRMRPNVV